MSKNKVQHMSNRNKKATQLLTLIGLCVLPVFIFAGCKSFSCSWCGTSNTYTPIYASSTESGVKYTSCIGPAALVNFGCSTSCWPTECMAVEFTPGDGTFIVSGTVCYYDTFGCIDGEGSLSTGSYYESFNCGVCGSCGGCGDYHEKINSDGITATSSGGCLNIGCSEVSVDVRNYNNSLPRQYPSGCCGVIFED